MNASTPSRRRIWLLTLVLLAVGTSVAGFYLHRSALGFAFLQKASGDSGPGAPPAGPASTEGVVCFGLVDLEHGVTSLYPLQPGRVVEVPVQEGQQVSAGTVLLRVDDRVARSRVAEARAGLAVAELQEKQAGKMPKQQQNRIAQQKDAVRVANLRVESARRLLERKQKLAQKQLIDQDEPAITEDQVKELEVLAQVEQKRLDELTGQDPTDDKRRAEGEAAVAREKVKQAEIALADCSLKAPGPGTVLRVLVGPGDLLSGQSRQPAILFAGDGPLIVRAEVEQENISRVKKGMPVEVEDYFDTSQSLPGTVVRVAQWFSQRRSVLNEATELNDVRTVECLIQLKNARELPLRIGQRVRVRVGNVKSSS